MVYIESPSTNPAFNLALEQYVFDRMDRSQEYFMLWQNDNTVVIGKNQNAFAEVNQKVADAKHISVVRRLSGGGAVYHDLGNLNYTLITSPDNLEEFNLKYFADPVIHVLKRFGIQAEFSGRNDLLINGKKFSGCSQVLSNGRLLYHGCILLNSNLDVLSDALRVRPAKIQSKGKGLRSQVGTLYGTLAKGPRYLEMAEGYIKQIFLDKNDEICGYEFVHMGKFMDEIKKGTDANEALKKVTGTYGRVTAEQGAVKSIDPRHE